MVVGRYKTKYYCMLQIGSSVIAVLVVLINVLSASWMFLSRVSRVTQET